MGILDRPIKSGVSSTLGRISLMKKEVKRAVPSTVWAWLEPIFTGFFGEFRNKISPRRRMLVTEAGVDTNEFATIAKDLAAFIPQESDAQLRQQIATGDADAMMKLADKHMYEIRRDEVGAETRDSSVACELSVDAARRGHPEACIQVAMLHYSTLNPPQPGEDFNLYPPCRQARSEADKHTLQAMWDSLDAAATLDYISPFLLQQAKYARTEGSWKLSNVLVNILARRQDAFAADLELQSAHVATQSASSSSTSELRSTTKWSENASAVSGIDIAEVKCYNPTCPRTDFTEVKFFKCSKCNVAKYCGADCQREDWKMHKRECHNMSQPGWCDII